MFQKTVNKCLITSEQLNLRYAKYIVNLLFKECCWQQNVSEHVGKMKQNSETELRNQTCMQSNYSLKLQYYTKKIEEGDRKQKSF